MKPEAVRIVRTDGGFAVYTPSMITNPAAVFTSPWQVLDWLAGILAQWEKPTPTVEPNGRLKVERRQP